MIHRLTLVAAFAVVGCTDPASNTSSTLEDTSDSLDPEDTSGPTSTGDTGTAPAGQTHAVFTTVSSDSSTGGFATISLDDWTIDDELFVTTGDAAVSADDGLVFQINRLGYDTARMYTPGDWTAPQWEKELADASNPGAAAVCDGSLFIALYGTNTLGVYDPTTGNQTGVVDLSEFDDGDGVGPEPDTIAELDGKLYVGLNRLDRNAGWSDAGGMVAEIDCATTSVTNSWPVGGNTRVHPWPDSGKLLVLARAFDKDEGGLYSLDPTAGLSFILGIEGEDLSGIAARGTRAVAISLASDYSHYAHHCIDLEAGTVLDSISTSSYYGGVAGNDRGEAWIVASPSWIDKAAPQGTFVFDIETCTEKTSEPLTLSLAPKDISFY